MEPPMGMWDMDSTPPAMMTSDQPMLILAVASAMACTPEEQKRLTVIPETGSGKPAPTAKILPNLHALLPFREGTADK